MLRLTFLIFIAAQSFVWAHGGLHDQIAQCTRNIQQEPKRAELYLKRAELCRLHGDVESAFADCSRAEQLDSSLIAANLIRGKAFADAGRLTEARIALDRFIAAQPNHSAALITRARVLARMNDVAAAESDFTKAIKCTTTAEPDLFFERAQLQASAGKFDAAISGLNEGTAKLGPLVSLEMLAIDLEIRRSNFDGALVRTDKLMAQTPRKEFWLVRRGEMLLKSGKTRDAALAFQSALAAIESLPPNRRAKKTVSDLEAQAKQAIQKLKKS